MSLPFFTIGHSNRSFEDFAALLLEAEVSAVADVRKVPRSRANPQFGSDVLPQALASSGIAYRHIATLGGLRGAARSVPDAINGFWENKSFHNYADYALTESFQAGLGQLLALGRERPCAIMCSEAVWWRCHRRIIADYLLARGETVMHIMGNGRLEPAHLTAGAKVQDNQLIHYPKSLNTP